MRFSSYLCLSNLRGIFISVKSSNPTTSQIKSTTDILTSMDHVAADDNDLMDIVDKDDKVIGTINQADARNLLESKAGYIRGTVAFIQNSEGKLWIPTRSADKRIAPNGLDFGVA